MFKNGITHWPERLPSIGQTDISRWDCGTVCVLRHDGRTGQIMRSAVREIEFYVDLLAHTREYFQIRPAPENTENLQPRDPKARVLYILKLS